jgi:hypothetical protein
MKEWLKLSLIMFDQGFNEKEQNWIRLYMSAQGSIVAAVESNDSNIGTLITAWRRPYQDGYEEFVMEVLKWHEWKKSGKQLPNYL